MTNIKRLVTLGFAPLLLASGLVAVTAPAATAGSIGGGGSHSGDPGAPGSGSCNGCAGGGGGGNTSAHNSKYPGIATFGAASRTNPNRSNPAPLGTYLHGPYKGGTIRDATTKQYNQAGQPCRANGGDRLTGPAGTAYNLPVGIKWLHSVNWNAGSTAITASNLKFQGCISSNQLRETVHICPVNVVDLHWKYDGGTGTTGAPRGGVPTLSGNQTTAFGTAYEQSFANKTAAQKIDLTRNCGALLTNYDFDPTSGSQSAVTGTDLYGNYQVTAAINFVRCTTAISSDWVQEYTNPNGESGWNSSLAKKRFAASEQWLGCSAPVKRAQENWVSYACVNGSPQVAKSAGGGNGPLDQRWKDFDFAQSSCGAVPPPEPFDCVVAPDARPEIRLDGSPGVLRSGATVTADGKQATITWPVPRISGDADAANVRDKRLVFSSNIDDVWNLRNGSGYDGLGNADPLRTSTSIDRGQLAGWNSPLTINFFRAIGAPVDSDQPPPFRVTATPTFTYDVRVPTTTFDPATGRVISSPGVPVETVGECPASSVELYVAGSRNTN